MGINGWTSAQETNWKQEEKDVTECLAVLVGRFIGEPGKRPFPMRADILKKLDQVRPGKYNGELVAEVLESLGLRWIWGRKSVKQNPKI